MKGSFADVMDKYGKQFVIIDTEQLSKESKFFHSHGHFGVFSGCQMFMTRPTCHAPESVITFDEYTEWLKALPMEEV